MESIFHGNSNNSGVYKIINKQNGRIYIGSAKSFKKRFHQHHQSLKSNKHSNKFLQHDFNKCGPDAFIFEVLEVVDGDQRFITEQTHLDQYYDKQDDCYNFKKETVQKERSVGSHTPEETKKKMSDSMKKIWAEDEEYRTFQSVYQSKKTKELWEDPEYRAKHVEKIREFTQRPEYKEKLSKAAKGKIVSKETREKLSKIVGPRSKELWKDENHRAIQKVAREKSWVSNLERKQKMSKFMKDKMAKTYVLKDPEGNIVHITNITEFCENYPTKLIGNELSRVYRGIKRIYKGWTRVV